MKTAQSFNDAYRELLLELYDHGKSEKNERTGHRIYALEGGHSFKLDMADGRIPMLGNRSYSLRVAAAEVAWQLLGTRNPAFVLKHAPKIWTDFVEDGELKTAYGYRWRHHFGRDQLSLAIRELLIDPSNRQLYISAWDPSCDGLGAKDQPKNIPCPVGFSMTSVRGHIHLSLFIRSSDVFVGLPYDVMGYALLIDAVATSTSQRPGTLHVTLAHPHIYDVHFKDVELCVVAPPESSSVDVVDRSVWLDDVCPQVPTWSVAEISQDPTHYLHRVSRLAGRTFKNDWSPKPELVL